MKETIKKTEEKTLLKTFSRTQNSDCHKSRELIFLCFISLFLICVDKSRERIVNIKLVSSGDAFLTPKRGNTASTILFHFNTWGRTWEEEEEEEEELWRKGREGRRDNETEQEEEKGRWDAGLIWAVKLLQWAGGQ